MKELYFGFLLFLLTFLYLSHLTTEMSTASAAQQGRKDSIENVETAVRIPPILRKIWNG